MSVEFAFHSLLLELSICGPKNYRCKASLGSKTNQTIREINLNKTIKINEKIKNLTETIAMIGIAILTEFLTYIF